MNIKKHIPNTITSMNMLCGVLGIIACFKGWMGQAFILMILAAVFDFFDGFTARLINAYSEIGKELDSLSDMVSFGVLPAIMLHRTMVEAGNDGFFCYLPICIAIFSGLRLAKFNIDERQTVSFIGLPTPACAMICGSLAYYVTKETDSFLTVWASGKVFIPLLSVILSLLLVSEIPMFSMKISKKGDRIHNPAAKQRITFFILAAASCLYVALTSLNWSFILFLSFFFYILINLISLWLDKTRRENK